MTLQRAPEKASAEVFSERSGASTPVSTKASPVGLTFRFAVLTTIFALMVFSGLALGSVPLSLQDVLSVLQGAGGNEVAALIVRDVRGPRTITALLVGAGLGVAGLQMQTLFRNPLADPQVLGVSSGASLGVALVILGSAATTASGNFVSVLGSQSGLLIMLAAGLGSGLVMVVVTVMARLIRSSTVLLLFGVMLGYFVSSGVTVLLSRSSPEMVALFTRWQFGSYHGVTWDNLVVMAPVMLVGILAALLMGKSLNALLLGERYAQTMGLNMRKIRVLLVIITSLLAASATAFCGPISFLGIAVPHLTRGVMGTSDHRVLLPGCVLLGGSMALAADILAQLPGTNVLPINSVNAAFGAPVVMFVLIRWYKGFEAT